MAPTAPKPPQVLQRLPLTRQQLIVAAVLVILILIIALKLTFPSTGRAGAQPVDSRCVWREDPSVPGKVRCVPLYSTPPAEPIPPGPPPVPLS